MHRTAGTIDDTVIDDTIIDDTVIDDPLIDDTHPSLIAAVSTIETSEDVAIVFDQWFGLVHTSSAAELVIAAIDPASQRHFGVGIADLIERCVRRLRRPPIPNRVSVPTTSSDARSICIPFGRTGLDVRVIDLVEDDRAIGYVTVLAEVERVPSAALPTPPVDSNGSIARLVDALSRSVAGPGR